MNKNSEVKAQNSKLKFKYLEDVVTSDIAFTAYGASYSELFNNAGLALEEAMVDTKTVEAKTDHEIKFKDLRIEKLLFLFLEELVYLKDAEELLFREIECNLTEFAGVWEFVSKLKGEKIDPGRHKLKNDVKAVTRHLYEVKQHSDENYSCIVVLDV